jgi:hypothetical protein
MSAPPYTRDSAPLVAIRDGLSRDSVRPILLAHGCVLTRDMTLGDWATGDVLLGGSLIVGVGPGLNSAAEDDGMIVVDCSGCVIMPYGADGLARIAPAEAASIAVYRVADAECTPAEPTVNRPGHLDIVLIDGRPLVWGGVPVEGATLPELPARLKLVDVKDDDPRLGLWVDERNFLRQRLRPGGRYDEARGDRESAYRGRFWIDGERIDYLDDEGFWAFGVFKDDRLDHAGYVLRRNP